MVMHIMIAHRKYSVQRHNPAGEDGFTVVELIITLVITSLFVVIFYQMYTAVNAINNRGYQLALSTKAGYAKLQEYENKLFSDIDTPGGQDSAPIENFVGELPEILGPDKTAVVSSASITPTLKAIDVKVTYTSYGFPQIVEYTTYIQESGLGR